jgi:excinuclease ABC subunit A
MGRVIDVMKRLRDAGNSLVVVEHDPQIMLEADRLVDMGPGPGERGGNIVFFGAPDELKRATTPHRGLPLGPQARRRAPAQRGDRIPACRCPTTSARTRSSAPHRWASAAPPSTTSRTSTSTSRCAAWSP